VGAFTAEAFTAVITPISGRPVIYAVFLDFRLGWEDGALQDFAWLNVFCFQLLLLNLPHGKNLGTAVATSWSHADTQTGRLQHLVRSTAITGAHT
jgi:hypothetical protein